MVKKNKTAINNYFSATDAGYLKIKVEGSKHTFENRKKTPTQLNYEEYSY